MRLELASTEDFFGHYFAQWSKMSEDERLASSVKNIFVRDTNSHEHFDVFKNYRAYRIAMESNNN